MDTTILEEFIEELKQIEGMNKKSVSVPDLMQSQIFVINEIIKLAEKKVSDSKNEETKKVENPYAHAFSPEEISIAVNESNELIMIERATGDYIVYSDQIGQTIFGMYANRIHQEATNVSK